MASASSSAGRPRYSLPAGLIFTPHELKQYRRWQSLHTALKPTECGFIPTAIGYEEFQQWLKKQDSGYFSDVFDDIYDHIKPSMSTSKSTIASLCRHALHPVSIGQAPLRCPICTVDLHIKYMKMLTRALQGANGRPLPSTGTPSEQQENIYLAWSNGKLDALRQVCLLEETARQEAEWSEEHRDMQNDNIHSATKALDLYWCETAQCNSESERSTKSKSVVFANDTNFLPGRPTDYFLRNSPRYERREHTIIEERWEDADTVSEDSEDYSRARVLTMGGSVTVSAHDGDELVQDQFRNEDEDVKELQDDGGDSDDSEWEDVDSDDDDDWSSEGSYVCFDIDEEASFIVFSDD